MPHYNDVEGLHKSLASIDENISVDVLIIDDGSKLKPTKLDLEGIYKNGKVFLELLPNNVGCERALNEGLKIINTKKYKFVGRLDCGDLNRKNKYTKQLDYLNKHPDIALLGTYAEMVDEDQNHLFTLKHPLEHKKIKNMMYFNNMFVHPTVVFKKDIIEKVGMYPTNYKSAEDYAYFFNILKKYKVANLPEDLLIYEVNSNSISSQNRKQQVKSRINIILNHFYFGFYPIAGLIRNLPLLFISRGFSNTVKKSVASK